MHILHYNNSYKLFIGKDYEVLNEKKIMVESLLQIAL